MTPPRSNARKTPSSTRKTSARQRSTPQLGLERLERYVDSLKPGDLVPTHPLLMEQLQISERAIRSALDELHRSGRIVRRNGVGTFVAEPASPNRLILPTQGALGKTIVAITQPDQSFFDRCVATLFGRTEQTGLSLVCRILDPTADLQLEAPPLQQRPLGFILFRYAFAPLAKRLQDAGCRVVLVGTPPAEALPEIPCIYSEHDQGGYLATRHLIDLGHRRMAFLADEVLQGPRSTRQRGHVRAIDETARSRTPATSCLMPLALLDRWKHDPALAAAYFRAPDAPTGIVAWNDHSAMQLMTILHHAGISVPGDVSVVGYDNLPESAFIIPGLTTIDHAIHQQIQAAVDLLLKPGDIPTSQSLVVMPTLVKRGTSVPPR